MKSKLNFTLRFLVFTILLLGIFSCSSDEENLIGDYDAPQELPSNLIAGSPLSDRILKLYDDYGIIVYTDSIVGDRMYSDLVSEEGLMISERLQADSLAAILYVNMIEDEFINILPEGSENLIFRNFYLFGNDLISGTSAWNSYEYISHVWYNSNADLTVGRIDDSNMDSLHYKKTFFYGLSKVLRSDPVNNENYYRPFVDYKTDAAVYYWQVNSLEDAYERGFLTANQNFIKSDQQDFDYFASWGATADPAEKDSLMALYPMIREKYSLVSQMFRQEGIPLEEINNKWQESPYNPKNFEE
jgi:hypothetical protein